MSYRESIGILREFLDVKSIPLSLLDHHIESESLLKKKKNVHDYSLQVINDTITMIFEYKKKMEKKQIKTAKQLENQMRDFFKTVPQNLAVVENSAINKMLALIKLSDNKELEGCCYLIASHGACLRQQILYRNLKSKLRSNILHQQMIYNLNPKNLDIDHYNENTNPKSLISTLKQLPSEWYVVQITAQHEHLKDIRHRMSFDEASYSLKPMHGLHLIVLSTGKNTINPICITLPKPNSNCKYDIRVEIESLLNNNRLDLTAAYKNNNLYWKMRKKQDEQMKSAISELEFSWLKEWRVLLLADYIEQIDIVNDIYDMIDKLILDSSVHGRYMLITERDRWLLKKIALGASYLQPFEIERAIKYILPNETKLAKNIILSIIAKTKVIDLLKHSKRKTLILIVDECLDHLSFESIKVLKHQPVSRFPSLHILFALFNQHKSSIKDGYKIINKSEHLGTFIVNPSLDLLKMEIRMKLFIKYWLPKWKGLFGIKPDLEFFKKSLTEYDILMYNGHGSGIQFLRGEEIERMRVLATVLLFGCSSIKLLPVGGRLPAYGISNQYLIGCSPCVLGMLWEVTDGDIDKMTTEFVSNWISSTAKRSWSDINQSLWHQGIIEFTRHIYNKIENEQDMLAAVAKSKDVCKQYMTSAAIIVRGLPIKLMD